MRKLLLIFVFVFAIVGSSFAANDEFLASFYSSMTQGCQRVLGKSDNVTNYCKCASETFKKDFSKKDEEKLTDFANSVTSKPRDEQMKLIHDFVSTPEYQEKMVNAASKCIHLLTGDTK